MHVGRAQHLFVYWSCEQALECARPAGVLIEKIAFGLTSTDDERAVKRFSRTRTRHFASPLALAVDFETHDWLELGEDFSIRVKAQAQARRVNIIGAPIAEPPSSDKFRRNDGNNEQPWN